MTLIPAYFAQKMEAVYEEEGVQWVKQLPQLIETYVAKWDLTVQGPVENLSYNYVAYVTQRDGSNAVLKMGVP